MRHATAAARLATVTHCRLNTLLALITVPPRSSRLAKSLSSVAKLLEGSGTNHLSTLEKPRPLQVYSLLSDTILIISGDRFIFFVLTPATGTRPSSSAWTWDGTRRAFSPQPINDFAPVLGLRIRDTWDLAMRRISKEFQQPCMEGQIAVVTDATVGVGWPSTGILRRMLEQGNLVRLPRLRFHKLGRGN
ncbi:hypothetical protein JB92DRAFT_2832799 [Gautieria morchelliformis]|nr:hypothetical protein JB92DRAFT_2832799 [Gautieria morchelliformis]